MDGNNNLDKLQRSIEARLQDNQDGGLSTIGIFIFGAGPWGQKLVARIREYGEGHRRYVIKGIFDNDPLKQGQNIEDILIMPPDAKVLGKNDFVVIASLGSWAEMQRQLTSQGIIAEQIIVPSHWQERDDKPSAPANKFCAAPWTEAVLSQSGQVRVCCRNSMNMGNWVADGLETVWQGKEFVAFRRNVVCGNISNECQACIDNGTVRTLYNDLNNSYQDLVQQLYDKTRLIPPDLRRVFSSRHLDESCKKIIDEFAARCREIYAEFNDEEVRKIIAKLLTIKDIAEDFLHGNLQPRRVGPLRQVNLISNCNARCIQCPGLYTNEIINGDKLDPALVAKAFNPTADIIDFFMMGSEFLLYPDWRRVARLLTESGMKLRISTNSILLNRNTIEFLIDNKIVRDLNISIDGATKETVEAIRRNVKWENLIDSLQYIFEYSTKKQYMFNLSLSFVLMRRNFREFPQLVKLVDEIRKNYSYPSVYVFCQGLEPLPIAGYQEFVAQEHHSLVNRKELIAVFDETNALSQASGIKVGAFYKWNIDQFANEGYPFPCPVRCAPEDDKQLRFF